MHNKDLFLLHAATGPTDASTDMFSAISSVYATCLTCLRPIQASRLPELELIDRGAILHCPKCGTRQAMDNERFNFFAFDSLAQDLSRIALAG